MHDALVQRLGIAVCVIGLVWLVIHAERPAPSIKNKVPAASLRPGVHLWQGPGDADETIQVKIVDPDTGVVTTGELLQRQGRVYTDRDGRITAGVRTEFYFLKPGLDIGAFGGYRPAARGTESDTFDVGLRYSPVRTFFGTLAPDIAISKDWIGAGASIYPPKRLVGPDWSHVGLGAWYGYPTRSDSHSGPGWTVGLSFSIK